MYAIAHNTATDHEENCDDGPEDRLRYCDAKSVLFWDGFPAKGPPCPPRMHLAVSDISGRCNVSS